MNYSDLKPNFYSNGTAELKGWHDPDDMRSWMRDYKKRDIADKTISMKDAVSKFVLDCDYLALGGFGHVRVLMSVVYERILDFIISPSHVNETGQSFYGLAYDTGAYRLISQLGIYDFNSKTQRMRLISTQPGVILQKKKEPEKR